MTTLREAAQQALEALEGWENHDRWVWPESALEQAKRNTTEALAALRAALAQEQANPPGCDHCNHPLYAATKCRVCGRVTEQAEPVNVAGPAHLAPKPAPGLEFDERGVLVPQQAESDTCTWQQDGDSDSGVYGTSCGHYFQIEDGTPADNKMAWCCYCGKKLAQELIAENEDE